MSSLNAIELAMQVAQSRRDAAIQRMTQAQRALMHANEQLEQLTSYAQDSSDKWYCAAQMSVSGALLLHHHQFMDRLRQAIGLQQGIYENLQMEFEESRRRLANAEARVMGLKKVHEKRQREISRKLDRREQHQMDEFAAMRHRLSATRL